MRKKRILFCSEATYLNTGYATYTREILNYLDSTGKYEIAELASYGTLEDPRSLDVKWEFYPAALPKNAPAEQHKQFSQKHTNQFGEYMFPETCLRFRPDIVCDIRDFWMMEFVERSTYRPFFDWCIMPTVDAAPQAINWMETFKSADAVLSYSDWSGKVLQEQSNNSINYIGSAPPSAHEAYSVIKDKSECRKIMGIPEDVKLVGTVMRNQRRKLYPDLFKMFRKILDSVDDPYNYKLYCHTSYPDMGWDLPQLLQEHSLSSHVLFTYLCTKTKKPFATYFCGPKAVSPFTNDLDGIMVSVQNGLSYADLSTIMQSFDLYVQYANSEGFGLPQVEAAAGSIPVASVNYSAMESVIAQLQGIALQPKALYKEMETGCMRAVPDNDYAAKEILEFLNLPEPLRKKLGFNIKQNFLEHFQWDKSGAVWEKCFDSFPIRSDKETWFSPPRIYQPQPMPSTDQFETVEQCVSWLVKEVMCKPEKIGSHMHQRMIRDIMYGFTTAATAGMYENDSSMIQDGNLKKATFNFETAYKHCHSLRMQENHYERKRKEAFNL